MPGTYKVKYAFGESMDSTTITVKPNPNMPYNEANWKEGFDMNQKMIALQNRVTDAYTQLKEAEGIVKKVEGMMKSQEAMPDSVKKALGKSTKEVKKEMEKISEIFNKEAKKQGIYRDPTTLFAKTYSVYSYIQPSADPISSTGKMMFEQYKEIAEGAIDTINNFIQNDWPTYQKEVEDAQMTLFKEFEKVE